MIPFTTPDPSSIPNIGEWISTILESSDEVKAAQMAALMYQIWENRNQRVHTKEATSTYQVVRLALTSIEGYIDPFIPLLPRHPQLSRPPIVGWLPWRDGVRLMLMRLSIVKDLLVWRLCLEMKKVGCVE
ncbi:hypothetical protein Droror1_Dr00024526 [Drosera rotundifolia]